MILAVILFYFVAGTACSSLDENCSSDSDCDANLICGSDKKCTCSNMAFYDPKKNNCLQYAIEYGTECTSNDQCEWLGSNAICNTKCQCSCQDGYVWLQGACKKFSKLGQACDETTLCYNGYDLRALTCASNICQCSTGFQPHGDTSCRLKSSEGNSCAINFDCGDSLECIKGECTAKTTKKNEEFLQQTSNSIPANPPTTFGDCSTDNDCGDHKNTVCFHETCVCKPGYFVYNKACVIELGNKDSLITEEDCLIKPSVFIDNTCLCYDYWYQDEKNQNCIKSMTQTNWNCLTDEWCSVLGPHSFCSITDDSSVCECTADAKFDETTFYCQPNGGDDVECFRDKDCTATYQICVNQKCICDEYYFMADDKTCKPKIGGSCILAECTGELTECAADFTCQCQSKDLVTDGLNCYPVQELGNPCTINEQCSMDHATCKDKVCSCEDDYAAQNKQCKIYKKEYDNCATQQQCRNFLDQSYQCRNSVCQCPVYTKSKDGKCVSTSGSTWLKVNYAVFLQTILISYFIFH